MSLTEDDIVEETEAVNVSIQSVSPSANFDPDEQLVIEILDNDGKNTSSYSARSIVIPSTRDKIISKMFKLVGMARKSIQYCNTFRALVDFLPLLGITIELCWQICSILIM